MSHQVLSGSELGDGKRYFHVRSWYIRRASAPQGRSPKVIVLAAVPSTARRQTMTFELALDIAARLIHSASCGSNNSHGKQPTGCVAPGGYIFSAPLPFFARFISPHFSSSVLSSTAYTSTPFSPTLHVEVSPFRSRSHTLYAFLPTQGTLTKAPASISPILG
jgi:hypothetical protein